MKVVHNIMNGSDGVFGDYIAKEPKLAMVA